MYTCCFSEDIYNVQIFRGNFQHYNRSQFLLWLPWNALSTSVMYDKALIIFFNSSNYGKFQSSIQIIFVLLHVK